MTYFRAPKAIAVTLLVLLSLWGGASAQTFGLALSAPLEASLEPELQLRDLELSRTSIDLRLAKSLTGPFEFGVAGRFRSTFGPLGTVAVSAQADADTRGGFELGFGGSGALASTGLDASLNVFNRNPGTFSAPAAYTATRPFFTSTTLGGGVGVHLSLGVTQRLGRTVILEATPAFNYASDVGLGGGLEVGLEFRRLIEQDNGALVVSANTGPGDGRTFFAGGLQYQLNRRGLPSLSAAALLGSSAGGLQPGFRASASGEVSRFSYRADLSAEPYRRDVPPYRGSAAFATELGEGVLGLELGAALANDFGVPLLLLRASYGFRL